MAKKITGYVGSPRKKGNTDIVVDTFLEGAAAGGAETQKFFLDDCTINQCRGCFRNCALKPGTRCAVHRDDMDMLLDELVSSDLNLFMSPLYCSVYSAIMARFFERCLPLWHMDIVGELGTMDAFKLVSNPAQGKKAVVGIVQDLKEPSIAEIAFKVFEQNVGRTYMMDIVDKIHVTDVRDVGDIKKKEKELETIFNLGKSLAEG